MTVQDLLDICEAEGKQPSDLHLVLAFAGGACFDLESADTGMRGSGDEENHVMLVPGERAVI